MHDSTSCKVYLIKATVDGRVGYGHHYSSHMQFLWLINFFIHGQNYLGTRGQHLLIKVML